MKSVFNRRGLICGLIGLLTAMMTIPALAAEQDQSSQFEVIELPDDIRKQEIAPADVLNIMLWEDQALYVNYQARVSDTGEITLPGDRVIEVADSTMEQFIADLRDIY